MLPPALLGPADPPPVTVEPGGHDRLLIVCDHAGRAIPSRLSGLGLDAAETGRHIGWDIGALDVSRRLAARTGATLVSAAYSRLVIDLNRYPWDPASAPEVSDGTVVPGNMGLRASGRERRVAELFRPYHAAIAGELDRLGPAAFLLSVHSMTDHPRTGARRPQAFAVSWYVGDGTAQAALATMRGRTDGHAIGDNVPYAVDIDEDYTIPEHAIRRGIRHLQVEFRQDLIGTRDGAADWADRFLPALEAALAL